MHKQKMTWGEAMQTFDHDTATVVNILLPCRPVQPGSIPLASETGKNKARMGRSNSAMKYELRR